MIALLSPWLKSINLYAIVGLIVIGGVVAQGLVMKGERNERRKHALETMAVNTKIVSVRAYDEAELAAEAAKAAKTDAEVKAALRQSLILTEETAHLLGSIR
jgi:hypothetical protein